MQTGAQGRKIRVFASVVKPVPLNEFAFMLHLDDGHNQQTVSQPPALNMEAVEIYRDTKNGL